MLEQILAAIGFIGLGALLKSLLDYILATKKVKKESQQFYKEERYKAIMLLCYSMVHYNAAKRMLNDKRPDLQTTVHLRNELHAEFVNMSLYASDLVIIKMKQFLLNLDIQSLNDLTLAMRKDLYGIKTKLKGDHFTIELSD